MVDPWSLAELARRAYYRTKAKLFSYIFLHIASGVIIGIGSIVLILLSSLIVASLLVAHQLALAILTGCILLTGLIVVWTYVGLWIQLATARLMIDDAPITLNVAFSSVKPLVYPLYIISCLSAVFLIGLLPLGLVTFFLVPLVWSLLFSFTPFILLTTTRRGADVLWTSVAMVRSRFWQIIGRQLLLTFIVGSASLIISSALSLVVTGFSPAGFTDPELVTDPTASLIIRGLSHFLGNTVSWVLQLVTVPFTIAFTFEMYRLIPIPPHPPKPSTWIIVSGVSLVLMLAGLIWLYIQFVIPQLTDPTKVQKSATYFQSLMDSFGR